MVYRCPHCGVSKAGPRGRARCTSCLGVFSRDADTRVFEPLDKVKITGDGGTGVYLGESASIPGQAKVMLYNRNRGGITVAAMHMLEEIEDKTQGSFDKLVEQARAFLVWMRAKEKRR